MPDPLRFGTLADPLVCPECGTTYQGGDGIWKCSLGHKQITLAWINVCKCDHDAHYDMSGFCLRLGDGCDCTEYQPDEPMMRQITMRRL